MTTYATSIRVSTGTQEIARQRTVINDWLSKHEVDATDVDYYADLDHSGSDSGHE